MSFHRKTHGEVRFAAELGARLRKTREKLGVSQLRMGKVMEVGRNAVARWELGQSIPTAYQLDLFEKFVKAQAKKVKGR